MKFARLVCTAFAVALIAGMATWSFACDKDHAKVKTSAASTVYQASVTGKATTAASPHACSAEMAAKCTPEMAAACKANKVSATTAAAYPSTKTTVVLASSSGGDACCASKGNKASKASAASMASAKSAGSCGVKGSATSAAVAGNTKFDASAAGSSCSAHGMGAMAANNPHDDCEACVDMSSCSDALDAVGAHRQAVRLKNGVMYVYTADSQRNVGAVQAAVARRGQHMAVLASAGDKARLCAECKNMRGAMASGKLTREIVNIEGGSLTLITSTDAAVVAKIHAMSDTKVAARIKS